MCTNASQGMVSPEKASFQPAWWVKLQAKAFLQWRTKHVWNCETHRNKTMSHFKKASINKKKKKTRDVQTAADPLQVVLLQHRLDEWLRPLFGNLDGVTQKFIGDEAEKQIRHPSEKRRTETDRFTFKHRQVRAWLVWRVSSLNTETDITRTWCRKLTERWLTLS